jgi:hypothetical protein
MAVHCHAGCWYRRAQIRQKIVAQGPGWKDIRGREKQARSCIAASRQAWMQGFTQSHVQILILSKWNLFCRVFQLDFSLVL